MYNDILSIGPVTIHGYGLMIGIGVVCALLVGDKRAARRGLDGELIYPMTLFTVVLGFLVAKMLFILTEWKEFISNPIGFLSGSGFVVIGGIIGGIFTIIGFCKIKKVSAIDYMDLMVPSVALAQGFGRLGCLLAGCCYGRETNSIIGIVFTSSHYAPNGVKLLPTQIIMSVGDFIIAAILLWYASKPRRRGQTASLYIMAYCIGRFFVEFLRNDYRGNIGILTTSQFIGIFLCAAAGACFVIASKKGELNSLADNAKREEAEGESGESSAKESEGE